MLDRDEVPQAPPPGRVAPPPPSPLSPLPPSSLPLPPPAAACPDPGMPPPGFPFGPGVGPGGPLPGYGRGWGAPPAGPGMYPGEAAHLRHRPGAGAVVAAVGLLMVFLSLFGLPWISSDDRDVSFPDIREAFEVADDAGSGVGPGGGGTTGDYLEWYAEWIWLAVLAILALAIVVSTLLVPTSVAARVIVGGLTVGVVGAVVMALDKEGTVGPKLCGALITVMAMGLHGFFVVELFDEMAEASPAYGVWVGVVGLVVVMTGCIIGTRTEQPPIAPACS